jgi:hypothetical protein
MTEQEVRTPTDREAMARSLARTYNGGRYTDAWGRVQEYRQYRRHASTDPEASAYAIAADLELPRGRVRGWMENDTVPDPVRALRTADRYGWLDLGWDTPSFEALNVLVAWIFASGSVTADTMVPRFTVDERTRPYAMNALTAVGMDGPRESRSTSATRATEIVPERDASLLGRVLAVLGAPVGTKSATADISLPNYLESAPKRIRLNFARTYLWHRGTRRSDRPGTPVQLREERPPDYRRQLKQFVESLVPDATRGKSSTIRLTAEATCQLYQPPEIPERSPGSS